MRNKVEMLAMIMSVSNVWVYKLEIVKSLKPRYMISKQSEATDLNTA
jgi:hypothetical protein